MKSLSRLFAISGALVALTASSLNNTGNSSAVIFLRGLACGLILSSIVIQIYLYIKNRKEKALEKAGI